MKVGLYSVSYFDCWNKDGGLTLEQFVVHARKLGFVGIEIGGKRPHAAPIDMPAQRRKDLKKRIADNGLELAAYATYSRFVDLADEAREAQLHWVAEQIRLAADLGAPVVRVFGAWAGVSKYQDVFDYELTGASFDEMCRFLPRTKQLEQICAGLAEAARIARDRGLTLALQNHPPVVRDWRDTLKIIRTVNHPALKACIDLPLLAERKDEDILNVVRQTGRLQVHSHFGGEWKRLKDGRIVPDNDFNYPPFVRGLQEIGYAGYLTYEFCHVARLPNGQVAGRDYIDRQVKLAKEYMEGLINAG